YFEGGLEFRPRRVFRLAVRPANRIAGLGPWRPKGPVASSLGHCRKVIMLIPRRKLFGDPSRTQARISPDGRWLSWLAPSEGVLNVWVAPVEDLAAPRCVTSDRRRGIEFHVWTYDRAHLLYIQDRDGDENWHVYAVDVLSGAVRNLTPVDGVH